MKEPIDLVDRGGQIIELLAKHLGVDEYHLGNALQQLVAEYERSRGSR